MKTTLGCAGDPTQSYKKRGWEGVSWTNNGGLRRQVLMKSYNEQNVAGKLSSSSARSDNTAARSQRATLNK